jgi:hypothetical protein
MGNLLIDYTVITVGHPHRMGPKMPYIPPLMYFSIEHRCCIMIGVLHRMWDTKFGLTVERVFGCMFSQQ